MNLNLFNLLNNSWIKMIRWGHVFPVFACTCLFLLFGSDCLLRHIGLESVKTEWRPCLGVLLVIFSFATIYNVLRHALRMLKQYVESFKWKGANAKKRILALSILAQEQIREHVERNEPLKLYIESDEYVELMGGNYIKEIPPRQGVMANCKLKEWVWKCFKRYPNLVKELHEMDEAMREACHF